jgi:hypothetical protein
VEELIRVRQQSVPLTRDLRPGEVPAAGKQARVRHSARHARSSFTRLSQRPPLSIRSAEGRRWAADLSGPGAAGLVLYGIGGSGKSTLAGQIATRVGRMQAGCVVSVVDGEVSAADLAAGPAGSNFIIFHNFDDNLSHEAGQWAFRDPALPTLLANWTAKLLITCRHPFILPAPGTAQAAPNAPWLTPTRKTTDRFVFRQLGPLTRSGAAVLTTSLPAIGRLADSERERAWQLTAGHPLAIEYLDSLLALGESYPGLAARIEAMVEVRTGQPLPGTEPTELPAPAAELIACAARDQMVGELFDRLSHAARALLVRASVFRLPVAAEVVAGRVGPIAECKAAGLLAIVGRDELAVHRWTADALHRRLAEAGLGAQVEAAHRQAAWHWQVRAAGSPSPHRAELEAGYHQRQALLAAEAGRPAGCQPGTGGTTRRRRTVLTRAGRRGVTGAFVAGAVATLSVVLIVEATRASPIPHLASALAPAQPSASAHAPASAHASASASAMAPARTSASAHDRTSALAPVSQAVVVRAQAATWAASQVSGGAIMACDPAMCAVLAQHGIAAENLLVLGPGSADPLGSDVVLATAAVRDMFGARLVSVYAPELLASFGTGPARIDIRAIAPDGAAAYPAAIAGDLRARRQAGSELLRDPLITFAPSARAQLATGHVDTRLLTTLDTLAASQPLRVTAFLDAGPGAGPGVPLRAAQLTASDITAREMLAFFRAQRPPYLPAQAAITAGPGGGSVLTVEFAAPAPLGLLQPQSLPGLTLRPPQRPSEPRGVLPAGCITPARPLPSPIHGRGDTGDGLRSAQ